jgi:prolyl oligopeptidase
MKQRRIFSILALSLFSLSPLAADEKKLPPYPASRVDKTIDRIHGVEVSDPYRWLEEGGAAEVREWVDRENAYARDILDRLPGREKIHHRLNTLLQIGMIGTPVPARGSYFQARREGNQNQPILYVREGLKGKDRVVLDPNTLSADGTIALDWWFPSRDGKLLAYGLSTDGSEHSTLHVRDVAAGKDLPDVIERTRACSLAWLPEGKGFYYTRYPAPGSVARGEESYHRHVYLHRIGEDPAKDLRVFGEGRPAEDWPEVRLSPDGRWLVVTEQQGWAKTEVFFRDCRQPESKFVTLVDRVAARYTVVPRNDRFYVHTNDRAPRYRVFEVDPHRPARTEWTEIIPQRPDEILEGISQVGDRIFCQYMRQASAKLQVFDTKGKSIREVDLPGLGSITGLASEWDGTELFYGFQSFVVPPTIYRFDLETNRSERFEQVKTDIDFDAYQVDEIQFDSKDGTAIHMFLAYKKGLERNGKNPTLLHGYGGFNISQLPTFSASSFAFLEYGGLLAFANLRGGGEFGEDWHQAGMLARKQNVFDDFIGAAEALIARKYTDRDHLAIMGRSNGGLLVGAALTQRPDLFRAVVCAVPLLDMLRYHKFLIARLWIPEYGSADDPEQFRWLQAYSPYHHVKDGTKYPAVLLEAAESDGRVDALHARKMAARLQAASSSDQPILLRLETKAGHGAGKPRSKVLEELTDTWSFLFWQLGMKP